MDTRLGRSHRCHRLLYRRLGGLMELEDDLNPLLVMLRYPPEHDPHCELVYYGGYGDSRCTCDPTREGGRDG
jgi:hypothetical protein